MTLDPFKPSRCTCSTTASFRAAIDGGAHLCPVHDVDEIATRDKAERAAGELAGAQARYNATDERYRALKALVEPDAPCTCMSVTDAVRAHLSGNPPEPCALHDVVADTSPLALNDDAGLAKVLGMPLHRSTHNPPPLDAA